MTLQFFREQQREGDWVELRADEGASYDVEDEINLSELIPLIALPSSPGNVVPVSEVAGKPIYQCYVGSSANPGYRDLAVVAEIIKGQQVHPRVSLDINPASRQILQNLTHDGYLEKLIAAGARIHQAGCNGCIGMGQAPATREISLRTVPRNFPGRSGTKEDLVYLCSPETAAASALSGVITDPRTLEMPYPRISEPANPIINREQLVAPLPVADARQVSIRKGPNIAELPLFAALDDSIDVPVLLKLGDKISTDEISPAGARSLPFRSNIPAIARFCFEQSDPTYHDRALAGRERGHAIIGGETYGQGSSREHAALAPRYLGLRTVITKEFARIHWQNLINFGILPLNFADAVDYDRINQGDEIRIENLREQIRRGSEVTVENKTQGYSFTCVHKLSGRQVDVLLGGGLINWIKSRLTSDGVEPSSMPADK